MNATRILVLGLVRDLGQAHGYRVSRELMEWEADKWANTKTGSIYHALRQLAKEGFLKALPGVDDYESSQRTDYQITARGQEAFFRLLTRALSEPQPRADTLCAGLAFIAALDRPQALELLKLRRERMMALREDIGQAVEPVADAPGSVHHVDALISFHSHISHAELAWLDGLIAKIEGGAYVFSGEGPTPPHPGQVSMGLYPASIV